MFPLEFVSNNNYSLLTLPLHVKVNRWKFIGVLLKFFYLLFSASNKYFLISQPVVLVSISCLLMNPPCLCKSIGNLGNENSKMIGMIIHSFIICCI